MSTYLPKLNEILTNMDGTKILLRKATVVDLLNLLDVKEAVTEINNSSNVFGIDPWVRMMYAVHKLLISESERLAAKDDGRSSTEKLNMNRLISNIVRLANNDIKPRLRLDIFIPLVLQILGSKIHIHHHSTYLDILVSRLLPNQANHLKISREMWYELLGNCVIIYKYPNVQKIQVLDAVQMIIQYGCSGSDLGLHIKKMLQFLEKVVSNDEMNQDLFAKSAFKLTLTVCQQIGTENRKALCEFSDNILRSITSLNGSAEKYNLLLFIMKLHHPKGRNKNENAAYAFDLDNWKIILQSFYTIIMNDCSMEILPTSFISFASEVFKQILEDPDFFVDIKNSKDATYRTSAKRRRTGINIRNLIDVISNIESRNTLAVIKIVKDIIENYPQCLQPHEFPTLLNAIIELFTSAQKQEKIIEHLYELIVVLIHFEKKFCETMRDIEDSKIYWDKIWDICLRSLSGNQNQASTHKLVQYMMLNDKNINSKGLLKLYLTNTIIWSQYSLSTLSLFCEYVFLPDDTANLSTTLSPLSDYDSVKLSLLKWVLNIPWHELLRTTLITIENVSTFLISFVLKSSWYSNWIKKNRFESLPQFGSYKSSEQNDNLDLRIINNIETCYLALSYEYNLLPEEKKEPVRLDQESNNKVLFSDEILHTLINSLLNLTENKDDVCNLIIKTTIISKVISLLKSMNIVSDNTKTLIKTIESNMKIIGELIAGIEVSKTSPINLLNITRALTFLYETSYDKEISIILISSTSKGMLKNLFHFMNVENLNSRAKRNSVHYKDPIDFSKRHLTEQGIDKDTGMVDIDFLKIQVIRCMVLFHGAETGMGRLEIQNTLINHLLKNETYDFDLSMDYQILMTMVELLIKYKRFENDPMKFLTQLAKHVQIPENVEQILNILLKHLNVIENYSDDLLNILNIFRQDLNKKKYGALIQIEFIKIITKISEIDSSHCWPRSENELIIEDIILYVNSPFYHVRLEAVGSLREIFSARHIDHYLKSKLYKKLEEKIDDSFIIGRDLDENEQINEKLTRTSSALLALAVVMCNNGTLQSDALFKMLTLKIDKNIDERTIDRVLQLTSEQINCKNIFQQNLDVLLSRWKQLHSELYIFPWSLSKCKSEREFLEMNIDAIAFEKIQDLGIGNVEDLCSKIKVPFDQVLLRILPKLFSHLSCTVTGSGKLQHGVQELYTKLINNKEEFQSLPKFLKHLNERLDEFIFTLIQRIHDDQDFLEMFERKVALPLSDPPYFKKKIVDASLNVLRQSLSTSNQSLQWILVTEHSNALPKILLNLTDRIYSCKFIEHKLKAFHHYVCFCEFILKEIQTAHYKDISMYLVREISYTLLHLIKEENTVLSEVTCEYFYKFLKTILPGKSSEVKDILRFCIIALNPLIKTIPAAKKVLQFLIVDQVNVLRDGIEKLDPFPTDLEFNEIKSVYIRLRYKTEAKPNLENEIEHFLNSTKHDDINNISVEGLANIRYYLSEQKESLQNMYNQLEEYNPSFLHQLVYRLMKLTTSTNNKVAIEAVKCLGELGPTNLSTMIVQIHINETLHYVETLTYRVLTLLTKLLIESDIECRKASAKALYAVFESHYGQKMLSGKTLTKIRNLIDDENVVLRTDYICPFIMKLNSSANEISIDYNEFELCFDSCNTILIRKSNNSYLEWIVEVTCKIINCFSGSYFNKLISICRLRSEFCELILPRIIYLIIYKVKDLSYNLYRSIDQFFEHHFGNGIDSKCDRKIVHCMLDVVNFIRIQIGDNHQVKLNYLCIAKAAQYCSAHFTALLYAELSCEMLGTSYDSLNNIPKVDYIYEIEPVQGKIIQNILRDAYLEIGDLDGIYACGSSHLQDPTTRVQHYIHTRQWDKVILAQDIELCSGNNSAMRDMVRALQQSGLQYLLGHFISTVNENIDKIDDFQYESSWRLCDWDINVTKNTIDSQSFTARKYDCNYYSAHYQALKFFHEGDDIGVKNEIQSSRLDIIRTFRGISLESSKTIYEHLGYLQMLREIEELSTAKPEEYGQIIRKWRLENTINSNEFYYIEPILTQRTVMYQINENLRGHELMKRALAETYLKIGQVAENQGHLQMATRVLGTLAKQVNLDGDIQDQLHYQESVLAWKRNDQEIGRSILRNLLRKQTLNPNLKVQVLRVYGDWMAETKSENPQTIIEQYYLKSITSGRKLKNQSSEMAKHIHHAQVALAKFVDAQFEQISAYIKSPQFEGLKECIEFARSSVKNVPAVQNQDLKRAVIISQRQSKNDAAEIANIEKEKDNYLQLAIEYYAKTLYNSDSYNLLIFRLIALWLDNKHDDDVDRLMNRYLHVIPSYKFIPIVPQLAAHMRDMLDKFSQKIHSILERCAKEHPHHTLPVLLALKNLYGDHEYTSTTSKKKEARVLGAQELIKKLNSDHNVGPILQNMDQLSHALVMLANYKCEQKNSNTIIVPKNQRIHKIKDFSNVLLSTLTINVKPNGIYNDIIGISKYQPRFEMVGGINAPKKVTCIGTDGISRNQLLKGTDDLRQDAVMQQVFTIMNTLLNTCKETKRRKLKIRTYKVMPLTQRSGILEWCDNTIPLGIALVGPNRNTGIHKKSFPDDWTAITCRLKMQEMQNESLEDKLKAFKECCKNLRPAFHHYFMDKYPSPEIWFERRLTYTRSVATTSIAGYILGLGDRHLKNILFDESTAEVIHIDLGIAFEQGKVLPLPETVPFRLTRDIEVAMGVSGVEGPMRRSCQEILTVLREQRHIIITLLQALRFDPLFTWAITPEKACNVQGGNIRKSNKGNPGTSETNKTAERAILRIEQKLQGTEEGLASSVSGQIERLIQQARDPSNLCRIYWGWEPYL